MDYTEVKAFFKGQAEANGWEFARNIEHLDEKIGSGLKGKNNLILVMDEPRGRIKYNGRHYDQPVYGFWLLKRVEKGKWEEEDVVYQEAKAGMFSLLSVMEGQKEDEEDDDPEDDVPYIWRHYDPNSVDYVKAGPETRERLFGAYVSFGSQDPINL